MGGLSDGGVPRQCHEGTTGSRSSVYCTTVGPRTTAASKQDQDFPVLWRQFETFLVKRFISEPERLISFTSIVAHYGTQSLRAEELAFLVGHYFSDCPEVLLCFSLFLPDGIVLDAGSPAAAMCALIQNVAPDKYIIFSGILKTCVSQTHDRGSRDLLLQKMQALFHGHRLVTRGLRKLLVQQFCIERNSGLHFANKPVEVLQPRDDDPLQLHSIYNMTFQVALLGGDRSRACALASNVLHLTRLYIHGALTFEQVNDELDRIWCGYPGWRHVLRLKELILSVTPEDFEKNHRVTMLMNLLDGKKARYPHFATDGLRVVCELFLQDLENQSPSLRVEVDHLVKRSSRAASPPAPTMQRLASLLGKHSHSCEKLGVLTRLAIDIRTKGSCSYRKRARRDFEDQVSDIFRERSINQKKAKTDMAEASAAAAVASGFITDYIPTLLQSTAETLAPFIVPARFRSQQLLMQLVGPKWFSVIYMILDEWNDGLFTKEQAMDSLTCIAGSDSRARNVLRPLFTLLESKKGARQRHMTGSLSRQLYDMWERRGSSYRRLPPDWPLLECSGRDALCWEVFNDSWASIPDSSESQARFTNRHEEQLLLLEDTRYEWDLRIGRLEATLRRLEHITEQLTMIAPERRQFATVRVSAFSQLDVTILRTIFGQDAEQVVSSICLSPLASIPTVHDTMVAKLKQWRAMRYFLQLGWTQQEAPHWAGAVDFKKRFIGRSGTEEDAGPLDHTSSRPAGRPADRMHTLIRTAAVAPHSSEARLLMPS
ncbi:histone deacetylase complex subunit Sin3 [Toxoplasma gondii RUB]|uniref:Histone deacetylase complex subunit Sin3 n=9 Tax=Toxoplasma gondii TaxID=5811 RepID=A0A125YQQ6_TOXGV|nr:histone deacetylase complex subunit Sin3 [Toxoplasma gondii GT1]ESS33186.1 histone deacetylase complex subunit Sin3 [Toxoplasma gondii VEG]KAF4642649.1 histone deacetylase complex subunit Sin3 [Toxoplasma gondii]KFG33726.1 histone deacetylase complex subunit Sin3 [Toxoplasma gondii p89]KFG36922.1 histone deacetylase complex subunit Sin3 [Toxoplasma gondii FOU]KFG38301.1 histone deacetylase complex subunit Sin3 [Toxoplasma gondii GAB2-2007-GAL-DOM2]KFG59106.1 histone deacetylase complex sub